MNKKAEKENLGILTALEFVLYISKGSKLEIHDELFQAAMDFLCKELSLTEHQVMLLAVLVDSDEFLTWKDIADYFKCSRLKIRSFTCDMEDLVKKRWVTKRFGRDSSSFRANPDVVEALSHDHKYIPKKLSGMSFQNLVDKVRRFLHSAPIVTLEKGHSALDIIEENPEYPLCKTVLSIHNIYSELIFLKVIEDYIAYIDNPKSAGISTQLCEFNFEDLDFEDEQWICEELEDGTHDLFELGLVEHRCDDGIADNSFIVLTKKAKNLLADYKIKRKNTANKKIAGLISHKTIKPKTLFYNDADSKQIEQLASLLSEEQLPNVQARLEERGFRKGVACLLHGTPGTGKTASVYELARQTGRDIFPVNIAAIKDKYVGESEKQLKDIFVRYRNICKDSKVTPILFFNEADALINKRSEHVESAVDKMENAMQNILLQEIEDLDGILIATTNLISNLDDAFDRRFLFKIELHKPEVTVKSKIWKSMLTDLTDSEAICLASRYDFSGGQIENVARKQSIQYIITGKNSSFDDLLSFCDAECLDKKQQRKSIMGFAA